MESQTSSERIKQLVQREGKAARNLVTWSVPIVDPANNTRQAGYGSMQRPVAAGSHGNSRYNARRQDKGKQKRKDYLERNRSLPPLSSQETRKTGVALGSQTSLSEREEICKYYSSKTQQHQLQNSKSPSRLNLHARYWSYLFDNLHRAVDEIYKMCDVDESVVECQEVIMTLEVCLKDFEALIKRIRLFEQSDIHKSSNLAWEVRKTTSPGKPRTLNSPHTAPSPPPPSPLQPYPTLPHHTPNHNHNITATTRSTSKRTKLSRELPDQIHNSKPSIPESTSLSSSRSGSRPSSSRSLDFSNVGNSKSRNSLSHSSLSKSSSVESRTETVNQEGQPTWADRVKGLSRVTSSVITSRAQLLNREEKNENHAMKGDLADAEDLVEDGWEKVTRGRTKSGGGTYLTRSNRRSCSGQSEESSARDAHQLKQVDNGYWENDEGAATEEEVKQEEKMEGGDVRPDDKLEEEEVFIKEGGRGGGEREEDVTPRESETVSWEELEATGNRKHDNDASVPRSSRETSQLHEEEKSETWTWNDALALYNANETYRAEKSWADRCDSPPGGLSDIPRSPGRAIHLHQRLSSPSRKRQVELEESRRIQEEKQAKAQLQRSKLQEEKTQKSKVESDKIREARESRDALIQQRKEALEDRLQRAEMLRESHLQERIRRAQEEEAKVSEISFINHLEAQNRKLEVQERYQGREARLQELLDERQRRKDEQLAKEEAAQERRKTMEAERLAKVMEMDQRRKEQEAKVEQKLLERERAREEAAKEKARERERKLMAHNAALQTSTEELGRKILLKQNESSRRYDQQIEQKKKLATASRHTSADHPPRVEAYKTKKWCTVCNVEIVSEVYLLSHLRGIKHQAALALIPPTENSLTTPVTSSEGEGELVEDSVIINASEEHQRPHGELPEVRERIQAGKKRAKKLRQRMSTRMKEVENKFGGVTSYSKNRAKLQRALRELNKVVDSAASVVTGGGVNSGSRLNLTSSQVPIVDRALGEISRSFVSKDDQVCFCQLGGIASVLKMLMLSCGDCIGGGGIGGGKWSLSEKTFSLALNVLVGSCAGQPENSRYLVTSNKAVPLVDLAVLVLSMALSDRQLSQASPRQPRTGKEESKCTGTSLCGPLLRLLASMVSTLASVSLGEEGEDLVLQQVMDAISYMVSVGLVDKLGEYFGSIIGPIEQPSITQLVLGGLNLLVATTAFLHSRVVNVFSGRPCDDPTLLTTLLKQTELVGLMQLLYAILLSDGPPRHSHSPPSLTQHTLAIAMATIKVVNNSAILDLKMVQDCLGAEGISLEFRHIVSYLLWYCSHYKHSSLLHELILAVGYFCVLCRDNQVYLQSGRSPTLLQLLCGLPFEYFSNPELSQLLYPTLIAACFKMEENRAILEEEISSKLLVTFLQDVSRKEEEKEKQHRTKDEKSHVTDLSLLLCHRFPKEYWKEAILYFSQLSK